MSVKQVGGTHYDQGDKPQHWDLSIMYIWDPFQYQITKYVMRWKDKHDTRAKRLEDLKKARSFLDKYIENFEAFDDHRGDIVANMFSADPVLPAVSAGIGALEDTQHLISACDTDSWGHENAEWQCEGYYGDGTQLYRHRAGRQLYRAASLQDAAQTHAGTQPGPGYVQQG